MAASHTAAAPVDTTLNPRVAALKPSKTMALTDLATKLKEEGADIIGLAAGEPDVRPPRLLPRRRRTPRPPPWLAAYLTCAPPARPCWGCATSVRRASHEAAAGGRSAAWRWAPQRTSLPPLLAGSPSLPRSLTPPPP